MSTPDLALIESRSLRALHASKTDVLDKVKALTLLPDGVNATTELVAGYYEVPVSTLKSLIEDNRDELDGNGYRVLRGAELREFAGLFEGPANPVGPKTRSLALFNRRTILNVGQLLTDSSVAERVRRYLLDVEDLAPAELRNEAIERAAISRAQIRMLQAAEGLVDKTWLMNKARVVLARGLGEEPELDPLDRPLYVPDFLKEKGISDKRDLASIQSWFGRRVVLIAEADGVEVPEKRHSELPNGTIRETIAWTERHRHLFEAVWDRYYAADYDRPLALA